MFTRLSKTLTFAFTAIILTACISMGNARLSVTQDEFVKNYPRIKSIVTEEAANNGFGILTSEVKPSEYNDWKGQLFYQLETANGTDQLFVEFDKTANDMNVWVHGAGTRGNANSAAKAISARLKNIAVSEGNGQAAGVSSSMVSTEPKVSTESETAQAPKAPSKRKRKSKKVN